MYSEKLKLHEHQRAYKSGNLRSISLDVTPRCNMNCPHCYAATFSKVEPISLDMLERALDEAYELGVFHYVLQGGEPIVDAHRLEAIIRMCYPDETYINVVTNGWAMDLDNIRWLKDLKVDKIAFSLDSGIEEEHDANRMKGSWKRVLEAIDNVLSEGLLASISVVVTHQSLHSEGLREVYSQAAHREIRLDVQIAEPVGKWDGKTGQLITEEDSKYIKQLQMTGPILKNGQRMINRDIFSGKKDHCPAGTEFMAISADGQILPCNFLQFSLGSIRDKTLTKARNGLLTSEWFDGKHPVCLVGENWEFINKYVVPYTGQPKPLDAYKVFKIGGPSNGR